MALNSTYGPTDARPGGFAVGAGVAGIAEATTAPSAGNGGGIRGDWLDPSDPKFWIVAINGAAILWIFWLRFVYRGAAL